MRFLRRSVLSASVVCALVAATPAGANEAAEAFLKSWVESIDVSPDWRASYARLTSDTAADTTTLGGLTVASERPGFTLKIDTVSVTGLIPSADGTFAAASVRLDGGEVAFADVVRLEMASAEFRDLVLPPVAGFVWNGDRPFVAAVKALAPIAEIAMSTGRIASFSVVQIVDDVESRTTYEQVNIDAWKDGKIAAIGAGPIRSQTPDRDQLMAMRVASAQSRDIDLNTFFHVYDPDNYTDGVGDGIWRQAIGKTTYRDTIVAVPGVTFTMKEATVEGLKMRQLKSGIGILANLGAPGYEDLSDRPDEALKLFELLGSHGLAAFTMRDMEVKAPGVQVASLAGFTITDWTSDKLGELALDRLAVAVEGQGAVNLRRFAFGDLVPPSLEAFIAAVKAQETGDDVDVSSVVPTLGFIEALGVEVAPADMPPTSLERFRLDLRDYVGPVPTSVALDLVDADVDAALIEDADARKMLADLGYDRVVLDAALRARWTSAGEMIFDSFAFAMKNVGSITGDVVLSGIRPTEYEALADESALDRLSFVRGSITAKDDSIVGRGLALQAAELGVDPEAFREQFAMGLPFMLAFLGDARLQMELAPVLQQFIKTAGGSITMVANPASPQNLMALVAMGTDAPFELARALSLTFSGIPGDSEPPPSVEEPAEPTHSEPLPEPAPEPTPEPAPQEEPSKENPIKGETAPN